MTRVFRPGVFDLLHVGHVACIQDAAAQGEHLIVGVQDDRDVLADKGKKPVVPLRERMELLRHIRYVDEVISYRDPDLSKLLAYMEIDVLAVGDDYGQTPGQKKTFEYCSQQGIRVYRTPRTAGVSSTAIRQTLEFWNALPADNPTVTMLGSGAKDAETTHEVDLFADFLKPTDRVLDLGCGNGRLALPLAKVCGEMVCVDAARNMTRAIRHHNIIAITADAADYKNTLNPYDVVIASGLFPCLDDQRFRTVCDNLTRLVRPGGLLLVRSSIGDPERIDVLNQYSTALNALYTAYYRTSAEISAALKGFRPLRDEPTHLYANHADTRVVFAAYTRADEL